ncbi:MAG: flagellar brake protein [Firmicutes bacterium]|nr:flagellar brake protein [Bacillota bacterium]
MKSLEDIVDRSRKITIEYGSADKKLSLKSEIAEMGEDEMYIYIPIHKGKYFLMNKLKKLKMIYVNSKKNVYSITGKIDGMFKVDGIPCYKIIDIEEKMKVQRRNFFRFPLLIDGEAVVEEALESLVVKDLSAGGLCGIIKKTVDVGSEISVMLPMGSRMLNLQSEVLSCNLMKDSLYKHLIRLKFIDITDSERKIILNRLFEEQRKMKRKGLESRMG